MLKLQVDGMTCGHCVRAVTDAVEAVPCVERVSIVPGTGEVTIEGTPELAAVLQAVGKAGYAGRRAA